MIDAFNKATKKFTDFFTYIESDIDFKQKNIHDTIIKISETVFLWQYNSSFEDEEYVEIFNLIFKCNYIIYNITPRKISFKNPIYASKVKEFKSPDNPAYTLNYIITFCLSAKDWLSTCESNIIIVHNDLNDGKVFCLLSALVSFNSITSFHPMDAYATITSAENKAIQEFVKKSEAKNHIRYLNYFSAVQSSPIITMKKIFLKSILINAAPAIDNLNNSVFSPYVTINQNSFYSPVIRIISNGNVVYCSYNKTKPVEKVFYSPDNCIIFNVNSLLFSDTIIEVLHKGDNMFKQLFSIQFHSLFITDDAIRFTRGQIDGACKDIRYPEEFFIDLLFDQTKDVCLSQYDEESIKWKNLISEFVLKNYKSPNEKQKKVIKEDDKKDLKENPKSSAKQENYNKEKEEIVNFEKVEPSITTVNQAQEMLSKMNKGDEDNNENIDKGKGGDDEDNDDDEDVENYLKNLENKTK